ADITVSPASENPCGSSLIAGGSCNYQISLNNNYNNGSALLTLDYNNGLSATSTVQTVYYQNNKSEPMVKLVPTQSQYTTQTGGVANYVTFNVTNLGNAPLNNTVITIRNNLQHGTAFSIRNNDCPSTLNSHGSCQVEVSIAANKNVDIGIMYLNMSGNFTGASTKSYSFISLPVHIDIIDIVTPTVVSTTPANTGTDVSRASGITLNFSESMNPTTLNNSNIWLQRESDQVLVPLSFQGVVNDNKTVNFTLGNGVYLDSLTSYQIMINPSQIKDANGDAISSASSEEVSKFMTKNNTTPTILDVTPDNGGTNISKAPSITISFGTSMESSTLNSSNIILRTKDGSLISGYTISYDEQTYTATINLDGVVLSDNTTYELAVNQNNIMGNNEIPLGGNSNYVVTEFTTGDSTVPVLASVSPVNGATSISPASPITLTFSESMNTSTLVSGNIKLRKNSDNSYINLIDPVYSNNNTTVTLTPSNDLLSGESYSVELNPSMIKDVAGHEMDESQITQTVSTFIVTNLPNQNLYFSPITSGNNPGGAINVQINAEYAESVTIILPSGFIASSTGNNSFTCYANLSCSESVYLSSNIDAGYYVASAVGLASGYNAKLNIPVAVVKNILYATNTNRLVVFCSFESTNISSCSQNDLRAVIPSSYKTFATVISGDGLYIYIMTGAYSGAPGDGVYKCDINQITKNFDPSSCVKQVSTGTSNTGAGIFSSNGKFFYYNDMSTSSIKMCNIGESGTLINCKIAFGGLPAFVQRLTSNFNGTSIFVNTGEGLFGCVTDLTSGSISSCTNSGASADYLNLAFNLNNTALYIIGYSPIQAYDYNQITGLLSNAYTASSQTGYAIAFSNDNAYIGKTTGLYKCNINANGSIDNCSKPSAFTYTYLIEGITIFN
ncbi:MAG: Ig-like domain-containing protein, partial [Burkholderiales bacterium]|nr:Ig-like domain-containing protein [Burkholderiales bacterium]